MTTIRTSSRKPRGIGSQRQQRLIRQLAKADRPPLDIADELGISPVQLGQWAAQPGSTDVLQHLVRLMNIRAQVLVMQFRANAAAQLVRIATAGEASELSRKACVDLLAIDLDAFAPVDDVGPSSEIVVDEESVQRALERLGTDPPGSD